MGFYFEPFTLQHNRYLIDLIARSIGRPAEIGPWLAKSLRDFSFTFEDLTGLRRIVLEIQRLKGTQHLTEGGELGDLKHLCYNSNGRLVLRKSPEVRSFVAAKDAPAEAAEAAIRYLSAVRERHEPPPPRMVSVLSYAVAHIMADTSLRDQSRRARLIKRQLLVHHADVACLQGLSTEGNGASIITTLSEEGYSFECGQSAVGANTIFWDQKRWELTNTVKHGAALAVDLRPFEDPSATLRVVCFRPDVPRVNSPSLWCLFGEPGTESTPLVACADLTHLGGAECAAVVEELASMPSVMCEVLGCELAVPLVTPGVGQDPPVPVCGGASGLNKLHCPDAVLYRGMVPTAVLSGHTEGYLTTIPAEDALQQFPAFRLPIVAAFDWQPPDRPAGHDGVEECDSSEI